MRQRRCATFTAERHCRAGGCSPLPAGTCSPLPAGTCSPAPDGLMGARCFRFGRAPLLKWNITMADLAQQYANQCNYSHSRECPERWPCTAAAPRTVAVPGTGDWLRVRACAHVDSREAGRCTCARGCVRACWLRCQSSCSCPSLSPAPCFAARDSRGDLFIGENLVSGRLTGLRACRHGLLRCAVLCCAVLCSGHAALFASFLGWPLPCWRSNSGTPTAHQRSPAPGGDRCLLCFASRRRAHTTILICRWARRSGRTPCRV